MIKAGRLFVGVIGCHSDRILFKRFRRWKPPENAKAKRPDFVFFI
jgi:hypothetical protein